MNNENKIGPNRQIEQKTNQEIRGIANQALENERVKLAAAYEAHSGLDHLTQLEGRGHLYAKLEKKIKQHLHHLQNESITNLPPLPVSVAYVDVDYLAKYNALGAGHAAGDVAVESIADHLKKVQSSQAFRIGGDEFVLVTDTEKMQATNDVARQKTEVSKEFINESDLPLGFNFGCADLAEAMFVFNDAFPEKERTALLRSNQEKVVNILAEIMIKIADYRATWRKISERIILLVDLYEEEIQGASDLAGGRYSKNIDFLKKGAGRATLKEIRILVNLKSRNSELFQTELMKIIRRETTGAALRTRSEASATLLEKTIIDHAIKTN